MNVTDPHTAEYKRAYQHYRDQDSDRAVDAGEDVRAVGMNDVDLNRLRIPLDRHGSDLLVVGDSFEEGGRYVQIEIMRSISDAWSWLEWDDAYDRLARTWRGRFVSASKRSTAGPS